MIDFSQKISLIKDDKVTCYFNEEWNNFISHKVNNWMNLFNRRLCNEDKNNIIINSLEKPDDQIEITTDNRESEVKNESVKI